LVVGRQGDHRRQQCRGCSMVGIAAIGAALSNPVAVSASVGASMHGGLQYTVIDDGVIRAALSGDLVQATGNKLRGGDGNGATFGYGRASGATGVSASDGRGRLLQQQDNIRYEEVESLRLSYKNILRVDNLVGLRNLTTLCLDNNVIEEIDNISHLVHLTWLDLSFNNIRKISGLEQLTQLKDLSLYCNQLESIESLEQCTQLECLSLGRNKINKLESVLYLRQFSKLRLVTLEGNPVCKDPEYRMYVLAHLEHLRYLDYSLIERSEVVTAREQYQDELLEAEEREGLEAANEKAAQHHQEYMARLTQAHLQVVETLFSDMFSEDKELPRLKLLPGFDTIYDSYKREYRDKAELTINAGLGLSQKFKDENDRLEQAICEITSQNERASIMLTEAFQKKRKQLETLVRQVSKAGHEDVSARNPRDTDAAANHRATPETLTRSCDELDKSREEIREQLMTIELQQVQQLKKLVDVYENRAGSIRSERVDHITAFFRVVEDLENSFATNLEELAQSLLEKLASNALDELGDDTVAFLSDRDNLMLAIQGAHDVHLGKLLAQEDSLRDAVNKELSGNVTRMKKQFSELNRNRVFEINRMYRDNGKQLEQLRQDVKGAEDEE